MTTGVWFVPQKVNEIATTKLFNINMSSLSLKWREHHTFTMRISNLKCSVKTEL